MLFKKFIKAYIEDLNSCWSEEIDDLTDAEIEQVADSIQNDDYIWEVLDEAVFDGLDKIKRNREDKEMIDCGEIEPAI